VLGMYPAIDTAIKKCTKVITDHSMPSNERPARKKEEHNRWIDENWTTIGIASYFRRDYEGAMKSFKFVRKFYKNDPSLFIGELWMAKTHIAQGDLTKAKFNLDNLDQAIKEEDSRKKAKSKKSKSKKSKKDKIAKFPKGIRFELEKTKAALAYQTGDKEQTIKYLEESLNFGKKKEEVRVHFILGQLYEDAGNNSEAQIHYDKVLKGSPKFEMAFNARLKKAFLGSGEKTQKELAKMLKDAKNAEYKDQIYYALAGIELKEGTEVKAKEYLHKSAFYSVSNSRQKGMAYEKLADMSFATKDYVPAQKYYDSCAAVIKDTYPNAEAIRNKARNLADLVVAVETAKYEDSVQMIAALSEKDREKFLKEIIKKIEEAEKRRKERDAERLRELQENENLFLQTGKGGTWYWNNAKTRGEGSDDFKKLWGDRENEDNWRRSEKVIEANFIEINGEKIVDTVEVADSDTLNVDYLTSKLPLTDSAIALSNKRLLEAHYNAGIIYKEQLKEPGIATEEFKQVINKNIENEHNLLSAFQLYKIFETSNVSEANRYKEYILKNYPNSDYANYLIDPNYFLKKKERDVLAEQEYVTVLGRYGRGLYYPVLTKANRVINNEINNVYRAKYMLLKAMAKGQLTEDKNQLLPVLDSLVTEYPGSDEAIRGQEMIDIIKNGYSENIESDFGSKYPFIYNERADSKVLVFLEKNQSSNLAKSKVVDFQREFFSRLSLKVSSKIYTSDESVILITGFKDESEANEYIRVYKKTRKYLLDLQNAKIF
ncbi:MAG: type IX secretion system periplasmic lipoprotein PorW/SprE, partial [Flavobacteriales bacterium]